MKLTTFYVSKTKQIYSKTLTVSERAFKIKAIIAWALSKFLHENENNKTLITNILESPFQLLQRQ